MPTDPRETLRRRQTELQETLDREKEEAARRAPHAELWTAWEELAQCTLSTLGLTNSPDDRLRFYQEFASRMIRVAGIIKAQGRLAQLAKLEGKETALDHAINLMAEAANGMTATELAQLLQETARDSDFIQRVGNILRRGLRDMLLMPRAETKQEREQDRHALADPGGDLRGPDVVEPQGQQGAEHPAAVHREGRQQVEQHQRHVHPEEPAQETAADVQHLADRLQPLADHKCRRGTEKKEAEQPPAPQLLQIDTRPDIFPNYPHKFPLVGERNAVRARKEAEGRSLDFQQTALVNLGFTADHWLPVELAGKWRTSAFPVVALPEAVEQWKRYLRECVGFATVASWDVTAQGLSDDMAHDLDLLRQYDPQLAAQSASTPASPQAGARPASNQPIQQVLATHPSAQPESDPSKGPIEVFFSYSHKDEKLRDQLEKHLSLLKHQALIAGWHDRKIGAGTEWEGQIDEHLNSARIILLLVSADFLASRYCYDVEMKRAMERHDAGKARVIPIILRPCEWHGALFGKLQALPKDGSPVTKWKNRDEAFTDVARGIRAAVAEWAAGREQGERP